MEDFRENVIEFYNNEKRATVTFSQGRYITKLKKLAKQRPEECEIVAENADGSITAHIPTKWVKINPTKILSEDQREQLRERMHNVRS